MEENPKIKELRDRLHNYYAIWNHSKKKGLSSLSSELKEEELEMVDIFLTSEIGYLNYIRDCCNNLIREINFDVEKLKGVKSNERKQT